jgi:alpha-tubulin N-acetyltransferase 1
MMKVGQRVLYSKVGMEAGKMARIVSIHYDDKEPYYTISMEGEQGAEKQTIASRLQAIKEASVPVTKNPPRADMHVQAAPTTASIEGLELSTWSAARIQKLNKIGMKHFSSDLDELGVQSGVAQSLSGPITSVEKLLQNPEQCLIAARDRSGHMVGFLKYGFKDLFFYNKKGKVLEFPGCICLLDFYVSSTLQRHGCGITLFWEFLSQMETRWAGSDAEKIGIRFGPDIIAYDRPSPKLLAFMVKHYGLRKPDLQPNRYTIFEGFPLQK